MLAVANPLFITMMIISAIVAKAQNHVIGINNQLPWRLPADLKYFKQLTLHHHVLMGRKTFESIGKPLPQRTSIVLTRRQVELPFSANPTDDESLSSIHFVNTIQKGIEIAQIHGENELFIIGGAEVYHLAMPLLTRLYITEVKTEVEGDAFFPPITDEWQEKSRIKHKQDEKNTFDYDFVIYEK